MLEDCTQKTLIVVTKPFTNKGGKMYKHENTIFNELYKLLPILQFNQYVGQHKIDRYTKKFDATSLLKVLLFAQASGKNSLRDIETSLGVAHQNHLYHLGLQSVAKSTIADHNNGTNPEIFENLFYCLLSECKKYDYKNRLNIPNKIIIVYGNHKSEIYI